MGAIQQAQGGLGTTPVPLTGAKRQVKRIQAALNGRFLFSLVVLLLVLGFAFLGPIILGRDKPLVTVGGLYDSPSADAWLGTVNFGRDVLTQLMYGTRTSLTIGVIAGAVATLLGLVIGTVAGFVGHVVEEVLMAITNVVITIPSIAINNRSIVAMGIIIGITSWPWTARAVRAQAASLRTREHVDIARLSGAGTMSLIIWEIIPFMLSYIVMAFVLQLSSGILQEAALSMLGLGPTGNQNISLGIMLQWALLWESVRTGAWWAFVPPALLLTLIAFSLLLLQSSIDEIFNPRLRRA
jgi:peptide/nickel transport system permease protein